MKTWIEISRENIFHNIKSLKSLLSPGTLFMAMVKSNAYGHGLKEVSKICIQSKIVDWFGVDNIDEAITLREQGVGQPILVLGYVPFDRLKEAAEKNISIVAYNDELLDFLNNNLQFTDYKLRIHIKVETGTARQGIDGKELLEFIAKAAKITNLDIEGIYTHYANIEDTTDPSYAMGQLKRFNENIKMLDEYFAGLPRTAGAHNDKRWSDGVIKHSACSAAFINYPETQFNMVRAGVSLYGMWPSNEAKLVAKQKNRDLMLKPALTWRTQIVQIKKIPAGSPISYGLTETVKRDSVIGILPVGYWDGYDRGLSGIGETLVDGKRAKVLGRVCMNMMVIDLTDIPDAKLFQPAVLLGKSGEDDITAKELAKKANTINYEIVARINPLIKRIAI